MLLARIHKHIPLICYCTISNNTTNISYRTGLSEVYLKSKLPRNAQIKVFMKCWVFETINVVLHEPSFINRNAVYEELWCLPVSVIRYNSIAINNSPSFLAQHIDIYLLILTITHIKIGFNKGSKLYWHSKIYYSNPSLLISSVFEGLKFNFFVFFFFKSHNSDKAR